jgi:hypothetical protein
VIIASHIDPNRDTHRHTQTRTRTRTRACAHAHTHTHTHTHAHTHTHTHLELVECWRRTHGSELIQLRHGLSKSLGRDGLVNSVKPFAKFSAKNNLQANMIVRASACVSSNARSKNTR